MFSPFRSLIIVVYWHVQKILGSKDIHSRKVLEDNNGNEKIGCVIIFVSLKQLLFVCRRKLEELMTVDHIMMQLEELMTVDHIMMLKDLPMRDFETKVWDAVGKNFINKEDRIQVTMISFAGLYYDFVSNIWTGILERLIYTTVMFIKMAAMISRFSLILSTTIKLQVDLASVTIERIEDTPCLDKNECIVRDEKGEPLIHTDGTGFISEDLALKTPEDFSRAKYIKDGNFERFLDHVNCEEKSPELKGSEAHTKKPNDLIWSSSKRTIPAVSLSDLAKDERNALKGGKLPITESFYLIGTADPTGLLESHQVCVILDNGLISGDLLVYRNPGLHFGDIHRLEAVYLKKLEETVGNAKYGIFFSTKGERSVANEIANGDFDGDTYWISRNPELMAILAIRFLCFTPTLASLCKDMGGVVRWSELDYD
ncbi:hypothetical protein C3L33_03609, partial [Rhododendron williamsianum]